MLNTIMATKTSASYVAMVVVQLAYGGSNILMKIALDKGLNQLDFVVYRHVIAMLILGPLAYVFERQIQPSLTFVAVMKIFMLSSVGTTVHLNVYYVGLGYTSPTVASTFSNVIHGLTFIISVLLGIEKVKFSTARGKAKVLGTLACVAGSLIFTFWKGGVLFRGILQRPHFEIHDPSTTHDHGKEDWIKGSLLILTSNIAWSAWLILQGIVISALAYYLQTWCISNKGPVFAAMFSPLLLVVVGIFSAIAFAEQLHLGSLIGALVIIFGLYCILWGKRKDSCVDYVEMEMEAHVEGPCGNRKDFIDDK